MIDDRDAVEDPDPEELDQDAPAPVEDDEPAPPPPDDEGATTDKPKPNTESVDAKRFNAAWRERQAFKKRAEERDREIETLRQENDALRKAELQRFKERAEAPAAPPIPNVQEDPVGHLLARGQLTERAVVELAELLRRPTEIHEAQRHLTATMPEAAAQVLPENPEEGLKILDEAGRFTFNARVAFHSHLGREAAIERAQSEAVDFVNECKRRRVNPNLAIVEMARNMGFRPAAPQHPPVDARAKERALTETAGLPKGGVASSGPSFDLATASLDEYKAAHDAFIAQGRTEKQWDDYVLRRK